MKILVIGDDLPRAVSRSTQASSLRTRQFVQALIEAGHSVLLVTWTPPPADSSCEYASWPNLTIKSIDFRSSSWMGALNRLHTRFDPDCVLALMYRGAMYATRIRRSKPVWMDLNGDILSENQLTLASKNNDAGGLSALWVDRTVLATGDVFSSCSNPQRHAIIGKLGLINRLTSSTKGYEFVHTIRPSAEPMGDKIPVSRSSSYTIKVDGVSAGTIPGDAILLLWSGAYNVWADSTTLFRGVEEAMRIVPHLHYVSTGGYAVHSGQYNNFKSMVSRSPFKDRFLILDRTAYSEVQALYRRANIGLSVDDDHYEVELGSRNRLIQMAAHGIPSVSTKGSEVAEELQHSESILAVDRGDYAALAAAITRLALNRSECEAMGNRAKLFAETQYGFRETTRPFLEWVQQPRYAPDHAARPSPPIAVNMLRVWVRRALWRLLGDIR